MASSDGSSGALRQRKGGKGTHAGAASSSSKASSSKLQRSQSWHAAAADHVMSRKRYSLLAGVLLGIAGMFVARAVYLDQPIEDMIPIPSETMKLIGEKFSSFEFKRVKDELFDYRPSILTSLEELERPGVQLGREENVSAYSPVVLIPGFSSTGLEIWNGGECSKSYFRQRMWGTTRMLQQFMLNQKCWLEHVMLNRTTGMDPEGIKLRAANGLEAADYLIGGFWVWSKVVENLADIGYDSNNLFMAPYDWRLAPALMEKRDQYFTRLKYMIEMAKATSGGRKAVVVSHSYATQVLYYFMKWVESKHGGNAGPTWVDDHIDSIANIAGPTLGTVKSVSALMSGEMKDTAELGGLSKFLEFFFGNAARASLARSWPSVFTMLPIGGTTIWGDSNGAPDDLAARFAKPEEDENGEQVIADAALIPEHIASHGSSGLTLQFVNETHDNLTVTGIHELLGNMDSDLEGFRDWLDVEYPREDPTLEKFDDPKYWTNPLATTLPHAPNLKLFCMYGVGKPVERGYVYKANDPEDNVPLPDGKPTVPYILETEYDDLPFIKAGVRYTDGDGTVPLISLGYMCARGWRSSKFNPGGVDVRVREYKHNPVSILYDPRGGPATSDHVDIMGNHELIKDLLRIASRAYDQVPEQISSQIMEIADLVQVDL